MAITQFQNTTTKIHLTPRLQCFAPVVRLVWLSASAVVTDLPLDKRGAKREGPSAADAEFGVARGVDFCEVTAVVNLDLPPSVEVYKRGSRSWRRADA